MAEFGLYALLGVGRDATPEEIEEAYCRALRQRPRGLLQRLVWWLNGRTPDMLAHARHVLLTPQLRRDYDERCRQSWYLPPG
jgi:hypothetical protein